jgi:hypothetical protein
MPSRNSAFVKWPYLALDQTVFGKRLDDPFDLSGE